ncbi:hypothetical protein [Butyricimonas sp. An62]|uniref:hypothetical protein n=1 Tax=Butyricimonas sp. An62 TaxID=1965649 RepID=UPI0023520E17|nr:hypothetical protein [Butyricimonas sp. An62]
MKIIQQPDILSFAGNVNDFVIEDVAKSLVFKLSVDGMVIVDEVYVAEGGEVRVSMKDIVDCFLSISIPRADSDYIIQSLAVKKFKAEIEDSVIEFTVVKGGISNVAESSAVFLKTQWLTLQPQEKRIVMHQPEYLSYYAVVTGSVKMTVYFADGSANETLLALEAGNLYTVDVSYLKISSKFERAVGCYDVWIENESGQRLTYVQRYILSTSNSAANVYLFENTLGGIDSVVFSGDFTEKIQTEGTVTTVLEESTDSDIDLNFSCEQNTGFIPSIDYARWLRGFFVSKQRYHVSGALRRIYLRESENGFTKNSLNDFTFEFFYSKQTKYDVVTRNRDDLPLLLEFPEVDSIPFLAPRLAEFPIAVVADDLMLPVQYAFENAWRRISIAAITQAVSEGAIDKIDLSSYWKKTELVRDGLYLKFLDKYIRAKFADDSTLWDGNAFDDYLDQAVKRDSDVQFRSFKSASFKAGPLGAGVGMVNDDEFQTDKLLVRKIMFVLEMMVQRMRFQLGQSMLTPGGGFKITRVEVHDTFYRLFFNNDGGRIPNYFVTNDQGRVQNHDGGDQKYFWGLVIATGNDYIDLSREDKDGDGVPAVGDEVVQLGNRDNPDRQDALMLTAVNGEVGMITYFGIDSFDLSGKEGSWFGKHGGKKGAVIKGEVHITSGSTGLKELEEFNEVETGINDARQVANDALALASSIVEVTASSQVFKYGYGFTGTPVPATITLTAITPKIEPTSYQWQFLNGTGWVNIESATKKTLDVMPGDPVLFPSGTNVRSFRCVCNGDEGFTDVFTLAKLADGAAGQAGSSGYTVLLTNESHTVSCDASGNPLAGELEKATTRVVVYKGVSVASFTLQNLVSAGGSFALDGDSGLKCTGLSESSATCTFEVKVDSVVIKKVFGVTKAKTGATGKAGADGKGISSTVVTYQASTSGTTVPTGTWGATIPSVSANQYLWTRTIVTYTDGTTSTSYSIGKMGANGATGAAGKGIKSTAVTYQASTSGTTVPTGTWGTAIPSVSANQYLWTRTIITYTDNTTSTSYSIGKVGATGAKGDKGDAGRGISSTVVTYQASTSGTTVPTGTWGTAIPSVSANQYLWTRTIITYTDNTTSTSYSIGKVGATGAKGDKGDAGRGISSTAVTYQASTSGTTVPTGTWGATIPSVSANQYLWTRTIVTYTDGTTSTSYSIGKMGANGATGAAGKGIKSTAVTYQASTSGTTVPTGTWGTAIPSVSANQYLWTRTIITYTDNTTSTSYSIGKMGANGEKGDKGDKGENGESLSGKMIYKDPTFKNGVNGVSVYNNSGNGTVTVTRIAKTSDVPSDSGYCLQVKTSGTASPGSGGVVQSIQSRPDAVFIQKIIAKLPVGYKLNTASNSMGSGYSDKWLTDTAGTGKYTTYLRKITCGSSGSFSSGGHVYVTGSPTPTSSAPLVWYIAYMSCFDQTVDGYEDIVNTAYSKVEAGINSLASGITIFAKKNDFDALGNRVSSAEASIKTNASNIELKVSKNGVVSAINASPESVKISASKIDLVGKVTFAMLDSSTQTKVNGKLDTTTFNTFKGTLKGLAYKDTVLQAMKDETIIEGGYIKTSLIRTDLILSAGAQIGNFKIGAVGGASGNWLTVSDGSMGVSGSQLFFNKSDRVVYVGSHPSEGTGGQPVLGYFNIGPTTPTLKSSEKCALYAASPRHSSYLIKSYALYAEVGDVRIVDGGFGGKTQGFNLSGSSAVIDCNFLIGALFAVQSNMKITIRPGFEGQMIKLLNYTTSSVTIVKNTDGAFVSRIPGQKCGLFYFDGQNWMGLIIGDFYIT